jgi:hypothetical protein
MTPALLNSIHMGSVTVIFRTKNKHLYMKITVTDNFSQRQCSQYCDYATDWMSGVQILIRARDFSLLQNSHEWLWSHPASYSKGTGVLSQG